MLKSVEELYNQAREEALQEVIRIAKYVLKNNKKLGMFSTGMGIWCFTSKSDGHPISDYRPKNLEDLFMEWDEYLKLTGERMEITADGKVRRW